MTWERVGKYALQSGRWTISKGYVHGEAKYLLWQGNEIVGGPYGTAEEAKERAR